MIIFLHGADTFRSRHKLKELKNKFLKEVDASGLNIEKIDAVATEWENIEKAIRTSAFLAKKRMVILEHMLKAKAQERHHKHLADILEKTLSDVIVVFWEEEIDEKRFKKNALFQFLQKQPYAYGFKLLSPLQLLSWISQHTQTLGGNISKEATALLSDKIGNDLWRINSEIEKLVSFSRGVSITASDVQTLVSGIEDENIFLLTNALLEKNKKRAMEVSRGFISAGMSETEILSGCLWQIKKMLLLKSAGSRLPSNPYILSQKLFLHPFVVKKILPELHNFHTDELKNMYQRLLSIDYQIKTGKKNFGALFDLFVLT